MGYIQQKLNYKRQNREFNIPDFKTLVHEQKIKKQPQEFDDLSSNVTAFDINL